MTISVRHFGLALILYLISLQSVEGTRIWNFLGKRALSPDNTCGNVGAGNKNGYTCDPALPQGGKCCSANGYCGDARDYCGPGCQAAFGTCDSSLANTDLYVCGPQNKGLTCAENQCCSVLGYCGNATDYCGSGCQSKYGRCGTSGSSAGSNSMPSSSGTNRASGAGTAGMSGSGDSSLKATPTASSIQPTKTSKTGGACGAANGGAKCTSGECCSAAGWCGTGNDYCADPDCQFQYGVCDSNKIPNGQSTADDPRPLLGKVSYDNDVSDCVKSNVVALTFDDGPYLYTSAILDVLKTFNFKGTFFITGNNIGKGMIDTTAPYPALIRRMIAEGHQVASHTWSHYSLDTLTTKMRIDQMSKNERAIANIIGKYPTYMRPPYSQCSKGSGCWADMKKLGYHRVYFDLDTEDYLHPLASQIQASKDIVKSYLTGPKGQGATDFLSIQHDIISESVNNLSSYYYTLIKNKGWKGVTVGECLNDPETNWYRTPGSFSSTSASTSSSSINSTSGAIKTTSSLPESKSASSMTGNSSTVASSDSSRMSSTTNYNFSGSSTSTSCSLTTGLTTDGQSSGISLFQSNSILSNSSDATAVLSHYPTAAATSATQTPSITGSSGSKSNNSSAENTPTKSGPAIPTTAGLGYAYLGCFSDAPDYRAVGGAGYNTDQTVEKCAEFCNNKSAPLFAVEYHNECFCGLSLNDTRARSTGCNLTCWGNPDEICGGEWAAQVYSLNLSTTTTGPSMESATSSPTTAKIQTDVGPSTASSLATLPSGNASSAVTSASANVTTAAGRSDGTLLSTLSTNSSPGPSVTNASAISNTSATSSVTSLLANSTTSANVSTTSSITSLLVNSTISSNTTAALNATTAANPTPTSTCVVTVNGFCGTIKQFNDEDACWDAVTDCTNQIVDCYNGTEASDEETPCSKYTDKCISLFWFCQNCTSTCSGTDFGSLVSQTSSSGAISSTPD